MASPDPRLRPMAYITDGRNLYEVISGPKNAEVELENCRTEYRCDVKVSEIVGLTNGWTLVRAAPAVVPDQPPQEATHG